jgi:hypothetical protein
MSVVLIVAVLSLGLSYTAEVVFSEGEKSKIDSVIENRVVIIKTSMNVSVFLNNVRQTCQLYNTRKNTFSCMLDTPCEKGDVIIITSSVGTDSVVC